MLNSRLRTPISALVIPVAKALLSWGVTPNAITIVGAAGVSVSALLFFPTGHLFGGTLVITAFIFSDLLDGTMARLSQRETRFGAVLDSTLDRICDASINLGLIIYFAYFNSFVTGALALSLFAGMLTSYVKAKAESLNVKCDGGLVERAERLIIVLVTSGFSGLGIPYVAEIGFSLVALGSVITVGQRIYQVKRNS